jgi:hypothetical protein
MNRAVGLRLRATPNSSGRRDPIPEEYLWPTNIVIRYTACVAIGRFTLRSLLAFLIAAAVVTVLIAPFVELPPSALQAWRAAVAVAMAMTLAAHRIHGFLAVKLGVSGDSSARTLFSHSFLEVDLWNRICSRLF